MNAFSLNTFFYRFLASTFKPDEFFHSVRQERRWLSPLLHLLALSVWLSIGSVTAWGLGVPGDTPLNSALGAQMDIYPYWRDSLQPVYGGWSYPLAAGLIAFEMWVITLIWTPVVYLVFRYLGGANEPGGVLRAFQGFVYGLTPCVFGGFIPYLALLTGVMATLLQFYRGPAVTLKNRTCVPLLFLSLFLALAIARYWRGEGLP